MATGYEDIDTLMEGQRSNLNDQRALQNQIIDKGIEKVQNEVTKQKEDYERDATKTARGLYTDYRKQANPYGATAETLASQGLNKSGYAESSQVNLYNQYQRSVTELENTTRQLKADADFKMNQAYLDADVQKAQSALTLYQQQAQLALQEYDMKHTRDREKVQDEQWERQFQLQREQFDFQKQQAQQSQANWEREYQMALQNSLRH